MFSDDMKIEYDDFFRKIDSIFCVSKPCIDYGLGCERKMEKR